LKIEDVPFTDLPVGYLRNQEYLDSTLSFLDAGVPIKALVVGVSVELASNGSNELLI
jgi:hypothetical protein